MRRPTSWHESHNWWKRAVKNPKTPRHDADPQCGYYARRAVKNGPLIPVRVYLDQEVDADTGELTAPEVFRAEELGRTKDPFSIWTHLRPITVAQFNELVEQHRTDTRMQATHAPIDVTQVATRP